MHSLHEKKKVDAKNININLLFLVPQKSSFFWQRFKYVSVVIAFNMIAKDGNDSAGAVIAAMFLLLYFILE